MPSSARSIAITDAYRAQALAIRRRAVAGVSTSWATLLRLDELDLSFARWLVAAVALTSRAQAATVALSDAYLAAFVSEELGRAVDPVGLDVAAFAGRSTTGRPLAELFDPTLASVKRALAGGRPPEQASAIGRARATSSASFETDEAGRAALDEAMSSSKRVRGWRRVTAGRACGACLASSTGKVQKPAERLLVHPHCHCTKEPVVEGAPDEIRRPSGPELFHRMSKAEQNALFAGRGGEAKAELVRSGEIELHDLITRNDQRSRQTVITETPLEALGKG